MSDHSLPEASAPVEPGTEPRLPDDNEPLGTNPLERGIVWLGHKLSLIFALIVVISTYEIIRRYVFDSPTLWVHETVTFMGASLFVFGGLYAFAIDRHVRVVLVYDAVSERARCILRLVHHLLGLGFCTMMVYASWFMAKESVLAPWGAIRLETSGSAWNPPFPALLKVLILIAMVTLTVQYLLRLIQDLRQLRTL